MSAISSSGISMLSPSAADPTRNPPGGGLLDGPLDGPTGGGVGGPGDSPKVPPRTDADITVEEWGFGGTVFGVKVRTGDGDDDIKLVIHRDGTSDMWVNGEYKGRFSEEQTDALTIDTGEGSDTVVIEDNRSFQDLPVPDVLNSGTNGTDSVEVRYPGYPPATFPLEPGQRSA